MITCTLDKHIRPYARWKVSHPIPQPCKDQQFSKCRRRVEGGEFFLGTTASSKASTETLEAVVRLEPDVERKA